MNDGVREFVMAGPRPQREALLALLFLASRRRGRALLGRVPLALEAADNLLAMGYYDDPGRSRELGWDPGAVVARGRALRRAEGRP